MSHTALEQSRLSFVLFVRGALLMLVAALAIRWLEQTLVLSTIAAGGVVGSFGVFEVAARLAMILAAVYGVYAIVLAARLQFVPRARAAVAGWGLFNLACAALLGAGTLTTTNALLYAGALYSGLLGLFQLFAAFWIRRGQQLAEREEDHRALTVFR